MAITTTNQQPVILNSRCFDSLADAFDPYESVKEHIVKPLYTPLTPSTPVTITDGNNVITEDYITNLLFECSGDNINVDAEAKTKEILSQTLIYYDNALPVQDVYAVQYAKKSNMLLPSQRVIYTPSDMIDAAKQLLSGQLTPEGFFVTTAFYSRIHSLAFYFTNDAAWTEFKTWFANEIAQIQNLLSPETTQLCQDLQTIKLNHLTESFVLRDDDGQNNEPYSFARLFVFYLTLYEQVCRQNNMPLHTVGQMPLSFAETLCPRTIIIVNVEMHAHALPAQIKGEWDMIKASMVMKPKVLGRNQLTKLTSVARMAQKMTGMCNSQRNNAFKRSAIIKFRKTRMTSVDLYKYIMRIYKHAVFVQNSENAVKSKKMTYQKPSRREPDNIDKQGIATRISYKPDLHVYLDCSGSISEREYQDAIKACIKLAKKMNVDFYFNSFSDVMSASTKLHVANRTPKQVYNEFKNTPKVAGGTDYEQIWHYINRSNKLGREVSIVVTDFGYLAPNHYVKHPKFLYYAPISVSNWQGIIKEAERFCKSMLGICPDIRKKILM
jgi:hypothetical protein